MGSVTFYIVHPRIRKRHRQSEKYAAPFRLQGLGKRFIPSAVWDTPSLLQNDAVFRWIFLIFSPLDYNSINSGKIPGAWTFVKLIVNLQLYGNKGNFPCFLFTNEYLSGGTFIRVGIILVIFPQIATPAADWNDVFDASNEGPGCPNLDQTDLKSEDCLRLNVYTGKVFFFFLSKLLHTNQAMYIRTIISFYLSALSSLSISIISNYVNFCTRVFETLIVTRYSNQYKHVF